MLARDGCGDEHQDAAEAHRTLAAEHDAAATMQAEEAV
jgi:hypothetical protein